jgi:hypothetical protein
MSDNGDDLTDAALIASHDQVGRRGGCRMGAQAQKPEHVALIVLHLNSYTLNIPTAET